MTQKDRNALTDKAYRWKFPIPYILGDDLGEFVSYWVRAEHCFDCCS